MPIGLGKVGWLCFVLSIGRFFQGKGGWDTNREPGGRWSPEGTNPAPMWMTAAGGEKKEGEKRQENGQGTKRFCFPFLDGAFQLHLPPGGSQGSAIHDSRQKRNFAFPGTAFLLKQKPYCPGKDFDFMLLKLGKTPSCSSFPVAFPARFAPATSPGVLGAVPELHPCSLTSAWLPQESQKIPWDNPQTAHPPHP